MLNDVFLSLNSCEFAFGKRIIFDDISLSIHRDDKTAIVGKNGVGKSTLFNIISNKIKIDSGELWINPKINIGYLNQREKFKENINILDFLRTCVEDPNNSDFSIKRLCKGLKIDINQTLDKLSGGMKRKLNLASIVIKDPDLLLLDEPTNHLDLESIEWLQKYLVNEFKGSFLVISHNRSFLKKVTNKVFWIDRTKIRISPKGFREFNEWSQSLINQEKREIDNKKKILFQEMEWMAKGVTARRKRNVRRKENFFNFKEEFENQRRDFLKSISKVKINYEENESNSPNLLVNFFNVKKKFTVLDKEKVILKNFNYKLMKGEKIGIIGKNGSGKSTFLNLVVNNNTVTEGSIKIRKNIEISLFDQSGIQFDNEKTIKENLIPGGGDYLFVGEKKSHICGYLKNFLFDPKKIDYKVGLLSGGERNRLLLAKILANPREILILDEPTNDLDMETIDILIDFLKVYDGGVLVASHDKDFLEQVVDKYLFLDGNGNYKISLDWRVFSNETINEDNNVVNKVEKNKSFKSENIEKQINRILKKIEKKELKLSELTLELEKQDFESMGNSKEYQFLIKNIKEAQDDLSLLEKEWYELEEKSMDMENS
jgi:ATP-binding cassette subfamily F protein uup